MALKGIFSFLLTSKEENQSLIKLKDFKNTRRGECEHAISIAFAPENKLIKTLS
ncbi:hypothetical protein [Staphylococcus chromogenes]|uniref:hypothetical protein n=1 Tax=Staphylococcus chromogenes TaxID=46126 RepID=UPI002DB686CB|nr:hypothetical protein [Staphylococcus chromogenes]MEB7824562.1 hypothetical protein [Staphylococcus chromogenes]